MPSVPPCRLRRLLTGSVVPLLAVGCAYLLIPAFGHAIWYDESYSVALTSHGWSGIWNLGSLDVHPIGYYMLLNLVRLVFGEHVVAYRLMSAAASCALVVAGYAMMRRDWGACAARLFAALACFAPPFMRMAFQIRMYSWAVLAVTMCFLFAMRICIKARGSGPVRVTEWIGFALFSLAGAYLHYYAVLVVTIINAIVLAASGRRDIPLRYALWTEDAWWDQRALPAYLDRVRVCHSWDMAVQSDTRQVVVIRSLPAGPAGEARPGNGEVKLGGFMRGLSGRKSLREHRVFVRPYDQDVGRVGLRRASVDVVVAPSC